MRSGWTRHGLAALGFCGFAVAWTWPLASHLFSHIPGDHAGDNLTFLWNVWWMRTALEAGANPFHATALFAPFGADLTLHTFSPLMAFTGATVLGGWPVSAALNVTILASVALNGWCAWLLGWRVTRNAGAAAICGLVFAGSPYLAAHMAGHFNLIAAWPLPLVALAVIEARQGSVTWALAGGAILGLTAYVDYYYVVYAAGLAVCLLAAGWWDWSTGVRGATPRSRRLARVVAALAAAVLVVIAAVLVTGGGTVRAGSVRVSVTGVFNPLQVFWLLIACWAWLRMRPALMARRTVDGRIAVRVLVAAGAAGAIVAAPIAWQAAAMILRGDYTAPPAYWRSGPRGIDLVTLVLGPPAHGLWGWIAGRAYDTLEIHAIESVGWLGVAPLALAAWTVARRRRLQPHVAGAVSHWVAAGLVFFVWALGSHLMIGGVNTGLVLPEALLHAVPILNNARMPGRALVVTHLALAVLAAFAVAHWRRTANRSAPAIALLAAVIVVENMPAPLRLASLESPAAVTALRDRPEPGAVLALPLGVGDGFGGPGALDQRALLHQTIHGRPMLGGFIARAPQSLIAAHLADPLLAPLLAWSEPGAPNPQTALPDRETARAGLAALGVSFVLLDRRTTPPPLVAYVEGTLPVRVLSRDDALTLYLVER